MTLINDEFWRETLKLESSDLVKDVFKELHGRQLNTTRARQVVAAYIQSKEYFQNAQKADISVKPLLLFYGVSSLCRCLTLLLKVDSGEESLAGAHGLQAMNWSAILGTDVAAGLKNMGNLRIAGSKGLLSDLLDATDNRTYLHVRSSKVEWSYASDIPSSGWEVSLKDIVTRVPDVRKETTMWTKISPLCVHVNEIRTEDNKILIKIKDQDNLDDIIDYSQGRISKTAQDMFVNLEIDKSDCPIFLNSYVEKTFGTIPNLYLVRPFGSGDHFSQLGLSFMLSYALGMLARYFPSHWIGLVRGTGPDSAWPMVHAAIQYIEYSFPQLVSEFIEAKASGMD